MEHSGSNSPVASFPCSVDTIDQGTGSSLVGGRVLATVRPGAAEATAVWLGSATERSADTAWSATADEERAKLNAKRSLLRMKSTARRYAIANLLTVNWTLTSEEPTFERASIIRRVNRFLTALRVELGEAFPYVYVLELHPGGHGYHVHLLLQERFIDKHKMQRMWGGIVWFARHHRDSAGNKLKARHGARQAAGYLLKYVTKDWGPGSGEHRYERSTGFNEEEVRQLFRSFAEALAWVATFRQGEPVLSEWESESVEDWHGPPVRWVCW